MWLENIGRYVARCIKYYKSKAERHSRQIQVVLIRIEQSSVEEIAMHFVGELPESEVFYIILVVTDWFTKVQYYILANTTWTAVNVAYFYIYKI